MEEQVAKVVGEKVLESLKEEERRIDEKLQKLNQLDEADLENIRERRLRQLKSQAAQRQEWKNQGHGSYSELTDQKEFFDVAKASKQVVVHFYSPSNIHSTIVDQHLEKLAKTHLETRFCRINAEKSPYLTDKLGIWMIPTLVLCKDREMIHQIVGLDPLGGTDKFSTNFLEYYLSEKKVLSYDGPIPETYVDKGSKNYSNSISNIRQGIYYDSDLDEDSDDE